MVAYAAKSFIFSVLFSSFFFPPSVCHTLDFLTSVVRWNFSAILLFRTLDVLLVLYHHGARSAENIESLV